MDLRRRRTGATTNWTRVTDYRADDWPGVKALIRKLVADTQQRDARPRQNEPGA